jgi:ABC-type branched-subunit amino acid transport system substrate-binding protein
VRTQRAAAASLALVLCAGCGSTVQRQSQGSLSAAEQLSESGLTAPGAPTRPDATQGPQSRAGTQTTLPGSTSSDDVSRPLPSATALAPAGHASALGRRGKIEVGFEYVDGGGGAAAATAIGAEGVSPGDQRAEFQVLVDEVNRRGGVAGHQLQAVYFAYDATGADLSTQEQAMCSSFTQDHKVFAALVLSISTDVALNCLQKSGALIEAQGLGANVDDEVFRRYSHYYTAGSLSLSRLPRAWVAGLQRQGFFGKGTKLGVVTVDDPSFLRTARGALPAALRAVGRSLDETVVVPTPRTVGDLSATAPAVQNAVLKFRSSGIDRVLFLEPVGGVAQLFMQVAESQGYRPKYGLTTDDELAKLVSVTPASQLAGAVGIGWFPLYEVGGAGSALSAEAKACLHTLTSHGIKLDDDNARAIALAICDQVSMLVALVERAGSTKADLLARTLPQLGRVPSAAHHQVTFLGRRDGISAVRDLAFDTPCGCFRYTGPLVAS